ncbi:unnamed protein product [Rotaria sp. Silwood2]|nr:unnamed protein product [Rotaria sp. Silwood2]CAF4320526.1 unnamed protein product [Rotaria sp. Silwood2]
MDFSIMVNQQIMLTAILVSRLHCFRLQWLRRTLHFGSSGLSIRGDSDLETVLKGLRKAIIEGYHVNLVHLLLPRDNKKYSRNDKNLTILEYILAFTRYLNIICEAFPQRRRELTAYLCDVIRLSSRFCHPFFYHHHRLFAQKAETLLQTRNILIDWFKRDHDIYLNVFSGYDQLFVIYVEVQNTISFCKKILNRNDLIEKMLSENHDRFTSTTSSKVSFLQGLDNDDIKQGLGPICKFYHAAGFEKCIQPNCRFLHLCSHCRGTNPKKLV